VAVTILLVRHARAGRRDRWEGDDRLRPLTKRGRAQAAALPRIVAPWTGGAASQPLLLTSPWVRCVETLAPLAAHTGTVAETEPLLGEGMGAATVDVLPKWVGPVPVVLCTHGDVIEEILAKLAASGVDVGPEPRAAKGSVWVLDGGDGTVRGARYLPPPA